LGLVPTALRLANDDLYKFNSLQSSVRKQLSHGLQLQGSYTWSRAFITAPYGINTYPYMIHQYELNNNHRWHRRIRFLRRQRLRRQLLDSHSQVLSGDVGAKPTDEGHYPAASDQR